jgi:carboxyl-terminal processing protease
VRWTIGAALLGCVYCAAAVAEDSPENSPKTARGIADGVCKLTDAVLANHVDPPARQQMILEGLKAVYRAAKLPVAPSLSRRVSEAASPAQITELLRDVWPATTSKAISAKVLHEVFVEGLLAGVPGGAHLVQANERKVAEQLQGNRYVGIHIALGMNAQEKRPSIVDVFEGGPADRAGVKKDDIVLEIDGTDTRGMDLRGAIDRLRGDEGTDVTVKVRQPKEAAARIAKMTRGQLPHPTVQGLRKRSSGDWETRVHESEPIAYLRISEIAASTAHELRKLAMQLESEKMQALLLDLRALGGTTVHPAVLLADSLLERGTIGRMQTTHGESVYLADADALLRGWPIVLLVDANTSGTAEWIAAALQDNHRAVVVGSPTLAALNMQVMGAPSSQSMNTHEYIRSMVAVADGSWSIELPTGTLKRGDGRPLCAATPPEGSGEIPLARADSERRQGEKPKSGVTPDHEIKPSGQRRSPHMEPPGRRRQWEVPPDDAINKGVSVLRDALKKNRPGSAVLSQAGRLALPQAVGR